MSRQKVLVPPQRRKKIKEAIRTKKHGIAFRPRKVSLLLKAMKSLDDEAKIKAHIRSKKYPSFATSTVNEEDREFLEREIKEGRMRTGKRPW